MKKISKLLYWFNSLKTNTIEILIIILSIIGLILSIIGVAVIPWKYTNTIMEVFFLIVLLLFIYSLFIPSLILYLRKKKNLIIIYYLDINSLVSIILCILCIIFNTYIAIGTIPDLKNKKIIIENVEYSGEYQEIQKVVNEQRLVSNGKLIFTCIVIILN